MKAQASEWVNVIIGLILVVIIIVGMMIVLGSIKAAKVDEIRDLQKIDGSIVYATTLSQMNTTEYEKFKSIANDAAKTGTFYGKVTSFQTISKDITSEEKAKWSKIEQSIVVLPKKDASVMFIQPMILINDLTNLDCYSYPEICEYYITAFEENI